MDIAKLLKQLGADDTTIERLEYCQSTRRAIKDAERRITEEKTRHEKEMSLLRNVLQQVQSKCQHEITTFYGDASGGSDSETICDICGARV